MFLNCSTCFQRQPLIIRNSKTVIAASGFTYACGCRQLSWLSHALSVCERPFALRCSDVTYRSYWGSIELILFSLQEQRIILYIINHLVCLRVYVFLQVATGHVNPSKTKPRLLHLKTQSVLRSKHFISVIKTNQFILSVAQIAVCSQINTKHINTMWAERIVVER